MTTSKRARIPETVRTHARSLAKAGLAFAAPAVVSLTACPAAAQSDRYEYRQALQDEWYDPADWSNDEEFGGWTDQRYGDGDGWSSRRYGYNEQYGRNETGWSNDHWNTYDDSNNVGWNNDAFSDDDQDENGWFDDNWDDRGYEYEADEGWHDEEWYDPSDWFNDEQANYESDWHYVDPYDYEDGYMDRYDDDRVGAWWWED